MGWLLVCVGLVGLSMVLGVVLAITSYKLAVVRSRVEELERIGGEAKDLVEEITGSLQSVAKERDDAFRIANREKKRADEQFALIEETCQERNQVWRIYDDLSIGAANAQDLLFDELSRILRVHNAMAHQHDFKAQALRPELGKALGTFKERHGDSDKARAQVKQATEQERAQGASTPEVRDRT